MADLEISGIDELIAGIQNEGDRADRVGRVVLEKGAKKLVKIHKECAAILHIKRTGGFIDSIGYKHAKESGDRCVEVYPLNAAGHGNDRRGKKTNVSYYHIGQINEFGTGHQPARPYVTLGNKLGETAVPDAMQKAWSEGDD